MKIEVWSDIVCPWCYIGKVRFERALAAFTHRDEVEVVFRSFELDPGIERGSRRDAVADLAAKKGLSEEQVRRLMSSVEEVAARDGLEYHLAEAGTGNTSDAHRLLHLAAERGLQGRLLDRLYRAHFTELRSVFDVQSLVEIAAEAGLDPDEAREVLGSDRHLDRVRGDEAVARSLGISGVPYFVIDGTFAVSGAQPVEVLSQALEQAWAASHPLQHVAAEGAVCEDGVCS